MGRDEDGMESRQFLGKRRERGEGLGGEAAGGVVGGVEHGVKTRVIVSEGDEGRTVRGDGERGVGRKGEG